MNAKSLLTATVISAALLTTSALPANAVVGLFVMADRVIKSENKKALATPGHVAWCLKNHAGYRPKWNNYPIGNGRIKYCSSPYYQLLWMRNR